MEDSAPRVAPKTQHNKKHPFFKSTYDMELTSMNKILPLLHGRFLKTTIVIGHQIYMEIVKIVTVAMPFLQFDMHHWGNRVNGLTLEKKT